MKKRHLDLGCGANPRNPYNADELWKVFTDNIIMTKDMPLK